MCFTETSNSLGTVDPTMFGIHVTNQFIYYFEGYVAKQLGRESGITHNLGHLRYKTWSSSGDVAIKSFFYEGGDKCGVLQKPRETSFQIRCANQTRVLSVEDRVRMILTFVAKNWSDHDNFLSFVILIFDFC